MDHGTAGEKHTRQKHESRSDDFSAQEKIPRHPHHYRTLLVLCRATAPWIHGLRLRPSSILPFFVTSIVLRSICTDTLLSLTPFAPFASTITTLALVCLLLERVPVTQRYISSVLGSSTALHRRQIPRISLCHFRSSTHARARTTSARPSAPTTIIFIYPCTTPRFEATHRTRV
jgi:hypothetical protein